jgi:hypothetical protein
MKTKYPKAMWLITAFYGLIIVVGMGQIFWAYRYGTDYKNPTMDGFYMIYRLMLSLAVILLFALRRRDSLYWTISIESATNAFVNLYFIYYALWHICRSESDQQFREIVEWFGIQIGWNAILCLISMVILGYMITTWKRLTTQPSPASDSSPAAGSIPGEA